MCLLGLRMWSQTTAGSHAATKNDDAGESSLPGVSNDPPRTKFKGRVGSIFSRGSGVPVWRPRGRLGAQRFLTAKELHCCNLLDFFHPRSRLLRRSHPPNVIFLPMCTSTDAKAPTLAAHAQDCGRRAITAVKRTTVASHFPPSLRSFVVL